jgi:hypothetical protein
MVQERRVEFENPRVASLFQDVPHDQVARLPQFRAAHPCRCTTINGANADKRHSWEYIDAGQGNLVILLQPGSGQFGAYGLWWPLPAVWG